MNFKNKTVFVTGTNRGIGKAIVGALLKRGAGKIYAAARNPDALNFNDPRIIPVKLDITDQAQVDEAVKVAQDSEILINNAGVASFTSAFDGDMAANHNDMKVNYFGTLSVMRAFIPALEKHEGAVIANVCSIAAFVNFPFLGGYSASKAALFSITQGARIELASKNIAVHSINPGPIDTDMAANVEMDKTSPEDAAAAILDGIERGDKDIFPDPTSQSMIAAWQNNYLDLEQAVADMMEAA